MSISKSFIDVLFILLLSTMVLLTQSVRLGALDTVVAAPGSGAVSPVRADEVQVVVVADDELRLDDHTAAEPRELAGWIRPDDPVLLVTADGDVRHHRVMDVWLALRERELDVKLGAVPKAPQPLEE